MSLSTLIEVNPVHSPKADLPILVTLLGIDTEESPLQPLKALSPIFVTVFGIKIEVKPVQYRNRPLNIVVVPSLILTAPEGFSPLYPYKKSLIYISPSGCSAYHFVPLNEEDSILVTLLGISIEAKLVQSPNILSIDNQ